MREDERAKIRKRPLHDADDHRDVADLTPGERMGMVWKLTLDAWAFMNRADEAERPMQRQVLRIRRQGDEQGDEQ